MKKREEILNMKNKNTGRILSAAPTAPTVSAASTVSAVPAIRAAIAILIILALLTSFAVLTGCASDSASSSFSASKEINVISREEGSGTRGAFIELLGIEVKEASGKKTDRTTIEAVIANKTDVVLTSVAGDKYSIGYISLGSLNDNIKAVSVDGVAASAGNIKNKTYKVSRPFNIATKGTPSPLAQDFISFILSAEGQKVVSGSYIAVDDKAKPYNGSKPAGKLVIAGSSSVSPVMEKLIEAYKTINATASIELQTSDSTAGMTAAMNGTCDIGMASRELKESELSGLKPTAIALDGIAVIVNKDNPVNNLASARIKEIFIGEITKWDEALK